MHNRDNPDNTTAVMLQSIDLDKTPALQVQTILQTAVSPRPIALASTVDAEGRPNLSPFSFFNLFSTNPPVLIFSPSRRVRDNTTKHTLENILETNEVVIGTVNYDMVQQVSLSSTEYAQGVNEFEKAGLTMRDADLVRPKLILESPVNFECKVTEVKALGDQGGAGNLVFAEVIKVHVNTKYLNDQGILDQVKLDMVARLGANWYARCNAENLFEVPKPLTTLSIGIDALPAEIRNSTVFTGNDLGMLANVERLASVEYSADTATHTRAQEMLRRNDVAAAWELLAVK